MLWEWGCELATEVEFKCRGGCRGGWRGGGSPNKPQIKALFKGLFGLPPPSPPLAPHGNADVPCPRHPSYAESAAQVTQAQSHHSPCPTAQAEGPQVPFLPVISELKQADELKHCVKTEIRAYHNFDELELSTCCAF